MRNVEAIPDTEQYADCAHPECCYEGTVGMTLFEVDGELYCGRHSRLECPQCRMEALVWLGTLGRLDWYRCRNCGWEVSMTEEELL